MGGSPVETGEVEEEEEEEEPLPLTNPRLPRNLDPVGSATRWDTPEPPVHSGDMETTSLQLHNGEIGFIFSDYTNLMLPDMKVFLCLEEINTTSPPKSSRPQQLTFENKDIKF